MGKGERKGMDELAFVGRSGARKKGRKEDRGGDEKRETNPRTL